MSSAEVIDALFERTIDIVQSLPKTGPIQTSYEEKLALYSLYKQATEGDVNAKRPGMLDMLGRAKWDAWAKRKGYTSQEAKQLYVESLLKTLRRFSDRPQAIALIEELESFSGDVAQRVMSASLARAGSDSDESSSSISARHPAHRGGQGRAYTGSDAEEDERDIVSQLPPRPTMSSRPSSSQAMRSAQSMPLSRGVGGGTRTPLSVEEASAMAVRGGEQSSQLAVDSDSEDEGAPPRMPSIPSHSSQQYGPRGSASGRGNIGQYGRAFLGTSQQGDRLYAPPNAQRYPQPPRSESLAGGAMQTGGAGASLYFAVKPSRPTPSEQHFYHHHGAGPAEGGGAAPRGYAASSVGGRSAGAGGAASMRGGGGGRVEIENALQSIQASLAAVHERLNQVERQRQSPSSFISMLFGSNSAFGQSYQAVANAFHDIKQLMGLSSDNRGSRATPSSYQVASRDANRAESLAGRSASGKRRGGASQGRPGWSALLRLLGAIVNLSLRLALDLTSVTVVISLCLLLIRRITGRGDPLFIFRLVQRYSGLRLSSARRRDEIKTIKLE